MSLPAYLPADLTPSDIRHTYAHKQNSASSASGQGVEEGVGPWGADGFTFADLIDIINPLQHIPVVSTLYRRVTGDEIAPAAQFIGSGLLGGVPGLMIAGANVAVQEATGQDIGETVLAALMDDDAVVTDPSPSKLAALAEATTPSSAVPAASSSGNVAPEQTIVASAGPASFFAPRPAHPTGTAEQAPLAPGAIRNKYFKPQAAVRAAAIEANAPRGATSSATVNTAPAMPAAASLANEATTADAKRLAANRAALLAVARDLRTTVEGHQAYNASERLKQLYRAQDGVPLRSAQ